MKKQVKLFLFCLLGILTLATSILSCKASVGSTEPTYYTVSFDSDGGTEVSSQSVESGKTAVEPEPPIKAGYTFIAWYNGYSVFNFSTPIESNLTLKAKWSKNTVYYTITYKSEEYGTIPDSIKNGIKLAENIILSEEQLPALSDKDAIFKGWYDGETKAVAGEYKVTKNVTLTAHWTDEATVSYSSVFGTMPTSFTAKLNQTITAENLTEIECSPYTFLGWFYSKDENGNGTGTQAKVGDKITADTTLYAKWKTATINFEPDFFNVASIKKYTGEKIAESEIISLSETGYTFEGWFDDYNNSIQLTTDYTVTEDTTFYAHFTPNTDTPYKVYHYQQNANNNLYTLKDTDNMTGTTETQTNAVAKAYEHFTAGTVTQTTIAADGSTIINIYYNRDTVTFTLNLEGGTLDGETGTITNTGKYGQTVNITAPTRTNYSFNGWNTTGGTLPATYETDGNYTAVWSAIKGISVQVQIEDIIVTKTQTGNTYTFSAETCDSYSWTLDDVEIATTQTCNIDISTFAKDTYILALEAKKGSKWYSYYAQIKVTE